MYPILHLFLVEHTPVRRTRKRLTLRASLVFYEPPRSNLRHSPLQASFQMRIASIILGLVSLRELVPASTKQREATARVASLCLVEHRGL